MPSRDEILEKVRETLVDALGLDDDEVTPTSRLKADLGAESIDFLDIVFRLEKNFNTKIPRNELFPESLFSADAGFDEAAGRLVVRLEAFLRPAGLLVKERHFRAGWLPANETVTESVAREECHDVTRPIFQHWVRRVREAAPQLHHV